VKLEIANASRDGRGHPCVYIHNLNGRRRG
jgi:hypothetical protein